MKGVAVFTEDRLQRDASGRFATTERRLAGTSWMSLIGPIEEAVWCVRVLSVPASDGMTVTGAVRPLPHYQGFRQAIPRLPGLLLAAWRITGRTRLVVAKCPGIVGSAAVIAASARRRPIAVQLVGDIEEVLTAGRSGPLWRCLGAMAGWATRRIVRRAVVVRYPTRRTLQQKYPAARRARSIFFTDADIDAASATPRTDAIVAGRIMAVGSQDRPYKGHDVLIRALARLLPEVPHAALVLIGRGRHQPELKRLARELGVDARVTFIDHVAQWGELSALLRSAEVFAMPSLTEGLPRALAEAMSLGVACVGSDAGGIVELLPPEYRAPRGDAEALARLLVVPLTDPDARAENVRRCREGVLPYTRAVLRPQLEAWHEELARLARVAPASGSEDYP